MVDHPYLDLKCDRDLESAERLLSCCRRGARVPGTHGPRAPPGETDARRPGSVCSPTASLLLFSGIWRRQLPAHPALRRRRSPCGAGARVKASWAPGALRPPAASTRSAPRARVPRCPLAAMGRQTLLLLLLPVLAALGGLGDSATGEWGPRGGKLRGGGRGELGASSLGARRLPGPAVTFYPGGRGWTTWRGPCFSALNSLTSPAGWVGSADQLAVLSSLALKPQGKEAPSAPECLAHPPS